MSTDLAKKLAHDLAGLVSTGSTAIEFELKATTLFDEALGKLQLQLTEIRAALPSKPGKWSEGADPNDLVALVKSCLEFLEDKIADLEDERDLKQLDDPNFGMSEQNQDKCKVILARTIFEEILKRHAGELPPKDQPCGCGNCVLARDGLEKMQ